MLNGIVLAILIGAAVFGVKETLSAADHAQRKAKAGVIHVWRKIHKPKPEPPVIPPSMVCDTDCCIKLANR